MEAWIKAKYVRRFQRMGRTGREQILETARDIEAAWNDQRGIPVDAAGEPVRMFLALTKEGQEEVLGGAQDVCAARAGLGMTARFCRELKTGAMQADDQGGPVLQ